MKKILLTLSAVAVSLSLVGCGPKVEVGSAQVGKVKTPNGFEKGYKKTSRFRLSSCLMPGSICDSLVLLDVGDQKFSEEMTLVMPKDRLKLTYVLGGTISIREDGYDEIYNNISAMQLSKHTQGIRFKDVYNTYAKEIINAETREFISQYSIDEIMSNREKIGQEITKKLTESINERTPFKLRYAGFSRIDYPDVITDAQVKAAERREAIEQERAEIEVSRARLERQLEEERMNRKIAVEKAESEAEVNNIIGESITSRYITYRQLEALDSFAKSDNTKVVPLDMLNNMSTQVMLGNEMSK